MSKKRVVKGVLVLLAGTGLLLSAFICLILLFPPVNTIKNYTLSLIRQKTGIELSLGRIEYSFFSGIELHDLAVRPPVGYETPPLTIRRIAFHYDLGGIFRSRLVVTEMAIDEPHVVLETKSGKTNLDALLEKMPPSGAAADKTEPASKPVDTGDWKVALQNIAVNGLTIKADTGGRAIDLERIGLAASGILSGKGSHLDLSISLKGGDPKKSNVRLKMTTPAEATAALTVSLLINVSADDLYNPDAATFADAVKPKVAVKAEMLIKSDELKAPWELAPFDIKAGITARADLAADTASLDGFTLDVNGDPWLSMHAAVAGIFSRRDFSVELDRLDLPLDRLAPYAKSFVQGIGFGGDARVERLKVTGAVPSQTGLSDLPALQGKVRLDRLWADARPYGVSVKGVDFQLDLASAPGTGTSDAEKPAVVARGLLTLEKAELPSMSVRDFSFSLDAKGAGIDAVSRAWTPDTVSLTAGLGIGRAVFHDKARGDLPFSLDVKLSANGRPRAGDWTIGSLDIDLSRTIRLKMDAAASVEPDLKGLKRFRAGLTLLPCPLKKALALLPVKFKAGLPEMDLDGTLGFRLALHGSLYDFYFKDLFSVPVGFSWSGTLERLGVSLPGSGIQVSGGGATFSLEGTPSKATLKAEFTAAHAAAKEQKISVDGVRIPVEMVLKPDAADARLGLAVDRAFKGDTGMTVANAVMDATVKAAGRLLKGEFDGAEAHIGLDIASLLTAKPVETSVKSARLTLDLAHAGERRQADAKAVLTVGSLDMPARKISADAAAITVTAKVHGLDVPPKAGAAFSPELVELSVDGKVKRLSGLDAPDAPLDGPTISLSMALERLRDLVVDRLDVRAPTLGLACSVRGKILNLTDGVGKAADFKTRWPELDLTAKTGLSLDKTGRLYEGIEARGKAGAELRIRSRPGRLLQVEGTISADHFDLTKRNTGVKTYEDGRTEKTLGVVSVRDFNADVPIRTQISLDTFRPVPGEGNILEEKARGVLYEAMRPYLREQANFRIKRLQYHSEEGTASKDFSMEDLSLDVFMRDDVFAVNRMYVSLLGGGVSGALQVQLLSLPPAPLDLRIHFENQITGIDPAALTSGGAPKASGPSEIATLVELNVNLRDLLVQGHIDFTRLSLSQLDDILRFLDPQGKDPSINSNRKLLNAWYIKGVKPQIKLVSMRLQYSNLDMDINMDAFVVGPMLQNILDGMKIRRFNIKPTLGRLLGEGLKTDKTGGEPRAAVDRPPGREP